MITWKNFIKRLNACGVVIKDIFRSAARQKVENAGRAEGNVTRDRHKKKNALFSAGSTDAAARFAARRYFFLAGAFLLTVILLLSLVVLRWGNLPGPELPGLEMKYGMQEDSAQEESDTNGPGSDAGAARTESRREEGEALHPPGNAQGAAPWQLPEEEPIVPAAEDVRAPEDHENDEEQGEHEDDVEPEVDVELQEEMGRDAVVTIQPQNASLSQAASPLPQWSLHRAFGNYVSEGLPSGGVLHRLSNGVFFRGTPGAPVSALWDGYVAKIGREGTPFSYSVLLKHEGGHSTFYGNLREVWVKEGSFVSRGENIGLLPHTPPRAAALSEKGQEITARQVPILTIWSGYSGEQTAGARMPGEGTGGGGESAEEHLSAVLTFYEDNPLLYLEVRLENRYLDPLSFIPTRN